MDYKVIVISDRNASMAAIELEEKVKKHIQEGWKPLGGACISSTKYSGFWDHVMTQTMIKENS